VFETLTSVSEVTKRRDVKPGSKTPNKNGLHPICFSRKLCPIQNVTVSKIIAERNALIKTSCGTAISTSAILLATGLKDHKIQAMIRNIYARTIMIMLWNVCKLIVYT
jgi:hypothetical protein